MNQRPFTPGTSALRFFATALLMAILAAAAHAQTSATDGATPAGLAPGSPAGSYPLSGFDNVNLYSGNLNFRLPLLGVGGRGGAGMAVTLHIDSVRWKVDEDGADGVTSYSANPNWWEGLKPGYGPGVLQGRRDCSVSPLNNRCTTGLTRLTFTAADGTEYELRDQLYGGQPKPATSAGVSRGAVFISADGSAATFLSDVNILDPYVGPGLIYPSGYLMLADGVRYRIDAGLVSWLRDRNGNRMTFTYDAYSRVTTITDTINRQVTITYANLTTVMYDHIVYKGFGGSRRTIKVWRTSLGQALRAGYSVQTYGQLFPELGGSSNVYNPADVVSAVELPDGRTYQLLYNPYGELARVVLPTGGAVEYDYTPGSGVAASGGEFQLHRRVTERRVLADGSNVESRQVYNASSSAPGTSKPWSTTVTVEHRSGAGALMACDRHYFYGSPLAALFEFGFGPKYPAWKEGREHQTEILDADGTTVLRRTANTWRQRAAVSWWTGAADESPANDPRMVETVNTIEPNGANLVFKTTSVDPSDPTGQTVAFDRYNNQTSVWEYGFGASPGTVGPLVRRSQTVYVGTNLTGGVSYDYACDPATTCSNANIGAGVIHLRRLPAQQSVYDAAGAEHSRVTYEYDNYAADTVHAPLAARAGISGLDASFTTAHLTRGNATKTSRRLLPAGTALASYTQYDVAGSVVKVIDPRGAAAAFDFSDRFGAPNGEARANSSPTELSSQGQSGFAFITSATNALGHTSYGQYDYYTGKPVDGEDTNGVVTSGYYNDPLDRPTQVVRAVGTAIQSQSAFDYNLSARAVTTTADLNVFGDNLLKSQTLYDGLGRTTETRRYESSSDYIVVRQSFDALGRASRTSNPYRPWQGESPVWTTTDYDALGRAWKVTTPDGAKAVTHFDGARALVTDQMGRQRLSKTDALGRLTDVWEVRSADGATEAVTFPSFADVPAVSAGYKTCYTYDVLGNLRKVEQGGQLRYFMYDSLSRMIRAKNPEQAANASLTGTDTVTGNAQWSLGYTYDANGNVLTKTDARGVTVTYAFDALNRNTTADYSDTAASPDVTRDYDGAALGKGRFWYSYAGGDYTAGTTVEHTAVDGYDALGRPLVGRQLFKTGGAWGSIYQSQRAYDLAGNIISQTYPSGRAVAYQYDAAGRLNDFRGNLGGGAQRVYSTGIQYTSADLLKQEQFGTDTAVYNKAIYNVRRQLAEIRVGTTPDDTSWNRGALINHYSNQSWAGSGTDNNGTLKKQDVYIPNDDAVSGYSLTTQFYSYDALNRLESAREERGGVVQWEQVSTFDRYGNRTISASSWGGVPEPQYTADAATNRLVAPTGYTMSYDNAGQLTYDNYNGGWGGGDRSYDAEGRMTSAQFVSGQLQTAYYSYNAAGGRVRRNKGAAGEVRQVYGLGGELVAEYVAGAAPTSPQKEYGYRGGELLITAESAAAPSLANAGFETPALGGGGYQYGPAGASWSMVSGGGITANNSAFTYGNGPAPEGAQAAFIQVTGSASQQVTGLQVGATYRVRFHAAQRAFGNNGGQDFQVLIDSTSLGAFRPTGANFAESVTGTFIATAASQTLKFQGVNTSGGDNTAFVDDVRVEPVEDVRWLVTDQLGTPRMVVDKTGSLSRMTRHDYLPYGEELDASVNGRSAAQGYGADDGARQKFTGYERDAETGLDYAAARYVSSSQGRFTSPDPLGASMRAADPQSFNRYAYTGNDPVNRTDPTGTDWVSNAAEAGSSYVYQNNIAAMQGQLPQMRGWAFESSPADYLTAGPPAEEEPEEAVTEEVTVTVLDAVEEIAEPQTPSQPCPPTGAQLAEDPVVQAAALQAMRDSRSGRPGAREQGGWIYVRNGRVRVRRAPPGTEDGIDLDNPPQMRGWLLVGMFHTHPLVYDKNTDSYIGGDPNPSTGGRGRDTLIMYTGLPGLVVAEVGGKLKITPYGPNRRGSNPEDAIPPSFYRGLPGNSADTRGCPP